MMNRRIPGQDNDLLPSVTQIVTAYLRQHELPPEQLAPVIASVTGALRCAFGDKSSAANEARPLEVCTPAPSAPSLPQPAVSVEQSVADEYLVCLEDGRKVRMLRRYLAARYGMSPDEYRQKWGLPTDYPMIAPGCSALKRRAARARAERAAIQEVEAQRQRRVSEANGRSRTESAADAKPVSSPIQLIKRDRAVSSAHDDADPAAAGMAGTVQGRVRWFDAAEGVGEIQLNGWSKAFRIASEHLRQAGLRRLYRGQEVEAQLAPGRDGQMQVARLQAIGSETVAGTADAALPRSGIVTRRNRRAVTVELKTEALRRVGTRLQAERLFTGTR